MTHSPKSFSLNCKADLSPLMKSKAIRFEWKQKQKKPTKQNHSTHKQPEMHMCVISSGATDALVLKHQVINIHNTDDLIFDEILDM